MALTISLFATSASGADIHGRVFLWGEPAAGGVVAIDNVRVPTPNPPIQTIDHRNLKLTPNVMVVPVGTTIRFANSDGMPCHLYSGSRAASFVLRPEDGEPRMLHLDRSGVVELFCSEHATAHAFIVVRENPYHAVTDADGAYRIKNVPAGSYNLSLWYEGRVIETRAVDAGRGDREIDFQSSPQRDHSSNALPNVPDAGLEASVSRDSAPIQTSRR